MVHHSEAILRESGDASLAEAVVSGRSESLGPRLAALCRYALRLTMAPAEVVRSDVDALRAVGLDDRAIVDANQVVSYFNYVNRIADGLGVELESRWPDVARAHRDYPAGHRQEALPAVPARSVPWITVDQMREVDRAMVEDLGITLARMMENAGRNLAVLARRLLGGDPRGRRVVVLAGPGGNGGGGLVAARHLANAGATVSVALTKPLARLSSVTAAQLEIVTRMGVNVLGGLDEVEDADLIIDAVLGYGQFGAPRAIAAEFIRWCHGRPVLALDVPSGLELTAGCLHEPHVRALATLTLALPKEGLDGAEAAVGELYLGDISVPPILFERFGLVFPSPFTAGPIVRLLDDHAEHQAEHRVG